jgi:hypothetical protein
MNQREASKKDWAANGISMEEINSGSLQRIADATEKMAASYDSLRTDRDYWKAACERAREREAMKDFRIRSLRGVITRMKRKGGR